MSEHKDENEEGEDARSRVFVDPDIQFDNILGYNEWLDDIAPADAIHPRELDQLYNLLPHLHPGDMIFLGHGRKKSKTFDPIKTMVLALRYLASNRHIIHLPPKIAVTNQFFRMSQGEPERPYGFYIKSPPSVDSQYLGKRFFRTSAAHVLGELRASGDWGMASEIFQFLGILNPEYFELLDGKVFKNINLPGLEVSSKGDGIFNKIPGIDFFNGKVYLTFNSPDDLGPSSGHGSLCQA